MHPIRPSTASLFIIFTSGLLPQPATLALPSFGAADPNHSGSAICEFGTAEVLNYSPYPREAV